MLEDYSIIGTLADFLKQSTAAAAVLFGSGVAGGGIVGFFLNRRNLNNLNFRRLIVFEGVSFRDGVGDEIIVDFKSFGNILELKDVFKLPNLENQIASATRRTKDGLLRLKNPIHHRFMMDVLEDHLSGNDWIGNMDELMGRATNDDHVAFMPTFYRDAEDGSMIRVFVVAADMLPKLRDPNYRARLKARLRRHDATLAWLDRLTQEVVSETQSHGDTALVREAMISTARLSQMSALQRAA